MRRPSLRQRRRGVAFRATAGDVVMPRQRIKSELGVGVATCSLLDRHVADSDTLPAIKGHRGDSPRSFFLELPAARPR